MWKRCLLARVYGALVTEPHTVWHQLECPFMEEWMKEEGWIAAVDCYPAITRVTRWCFQQRDNLGDVIFCEIKPATDGQSPHVLIYTRNPEHCFHGGGDGSQGSQGLVSGGRRHWWTVQGCN